jgi:hypothetical protein
MGEHPGALFGIKWNPLLDKVIFLVRPSESQYCSDKLEKLMKSRVWEVWGVWEESRSSQFFVFPLFPLFPIPASTDNLLNRAVLEPGVANWTARYVCIVQVFDKCS